MDSNLGWERWVRKTERVRAKKSIVARREERERRKRTGE